MNFGSLVTAFGKCLNFAKYFDFCWIYLYLYYELFCISHEQCSTSYALVLKPLFTVKIVKIILYRAIFFSIIRYTA